MTNIIGENIKILRERMGLSQTNIAQFLNVGQSLISKVERESATYRLICWKRLRVCLELL